MLGVDVNSECIQMLEVYLKKQRFYIQKTAEQRLPPGAVIQQRVVQSEIFKKELAVLIKAGFPRGKPCIMALPVNQVLHKTLPIMPELSQAELEAHIQREVLAVVPQKMSEIVWDYCIIPGKNEILVTLAQQENLFSCVDLFNACGLNLKVIDVESYALARAWRVCYPEFASTSGLYGIALLRAQLITLVLIYRNGVIAARSVPFEWGENLSSTLAQLISSLPLEQELLPLKQLWLAGEIVQTHDVSALENHLNIPVKIVEFGENVQGCALLEASKLFLNLGIALWGKC
jgi:type IV pilus assembly protein PilM